jgi:hypothetical protein
VALLNSVADTLISLVLLGGVFIPGAAQGQTADEYQVKAAYMYNLAKFVDWPSDAFETPSQPIVFCVLGLTPLNRPLEDALTRKVVGARPLVFRQISDSKQASECKVLFINLPDKKRCRQTLELVKSLHILTVGEADDFTEQGGVARFLLDEGRVRLEFNLDAAADAKLHISSKLLSLGKTMRKAGK